MFSELEESGNNNVGSIGGDEVRAPLPVVRETLYDDAMLYGYVSSFCVLFLTACWLQWYLFFLLFFFYVKLQLCMLVFLFWSYLFVSLPCVRACILILCLGVV